MKLFPFALLVFSSLLFQPLMAKPAEVPLLRNCLNAANQIKPAQDREDQIVKCLWEASTFINERITQLNQVSYWRYGTTFAEAQLKGLSAGVEKQCGYSKSRSQLDVQYVDIQQTEAILCMLESYQGIVNNIANSPVQEITIKPQPQTLSGEFTAEEFGQAGFLRFFGNYFLAPSEHQFGISLNFDSQWIIIGTGELDGYGGALNKLQYNAQTGQVSFETIAESGSGNGDQFPLKANGYLDHNILILDITFQSDKPQRTVLFFQP